MKTEIEKPKMGRKPVHFMDAKSVLNMNSGFAHKLLCTGPTMTAGNACQFSCSFCYVDALLARNPQMIAIKNASGQAHEDMVIRRSNAVETLRSQLLTQKGERRKANNEPHTVYCSPLVDCAANMELARETSEMCDLLLEHTEWEIRLLSKSNLLSRVAGICHPTIKARGIFGVSTGTFDDDLAASFEIGTARVSRRLRDLYRLQDEGFRTFGMICPMLPQQDYQGFAEQMAQAIRVDACEHIWVEVLNARGPSLTRTTEALRAGGYDWEADQLEMVARDKDEWEQYARDAFLAFREIIPAEKLRFMQYVSSDTLDWWAQHSDQGALLLGSAAENNTINQ